MAAHAFIGSYRSVHGQRSLGNHCLVRLTDALSCRSKAADGAPFVSFAWFSARIGKKPTQPRSASGPSLCTSEQPRAQEQRRPVRPGLPRKQTSLRLYRTRRRCRRAQSPHHHRHRCSVRRSSRVQPPLRRYVNQSDPRSLRTVARPDQNRPGHSMGGGRRQARQRAKRSEAAR